MRSRGICSRSLVATLPAAPFRGSRFGDKPTTSSHVAIDPPSLAIPDSHPLGCTWKLSVTAAQPQQYLDVFGQRRPQVPPPVSQKGLWALLEQPKYFELVCGGIFKNLKCIVFIMEETCPPVWQLEPSVPLPICAGHPSRFT